MCWYFQCFSLEVNLNSSEGCEFHTFLKMMTKFPGMLAVKSPTHQRLFKSLRIRHTVYSHGNIQLSTTEILKSQKTVHYPLLFWLSWFLGIVIQYGIQFINRSMSWYTFLSDKITSNIRGLVTHFLTNRFLLCIILRNGPTSLGKVH